MSEKTKAKSMVITGVRVKNFLILGDIKLKVGSRLTQIVGRNGQGKTSILKAIQAGFKGADPSVIRKGADKSEILIEIDDGADSGGISIERTIKPTSSTLKVKAPMSLPGGQTKVQAIPAGKEFLDSLITVQAFDPLQLILLKGNERTKYFRKIFKTTLTAEMLKGLLSQEDIGRLDFTKDGTEVIEDLTSSKRGILYIRRTDINKQAAQKKALWQQQEEKIKGIPRESFTDKGPAIEKELRVKEDEKLAAETTKRQVEGSAKLRERLQKGIAEAEEQLAKTIILSPDRVEQLKAEARAKEDEILKLRAAIDDIVQFITDNETAEKEITNLQKKIKDDTGTLEALPKTADIPDIEAIERAVSALEEAKAENGQRKAAQEEIALSATLGQAYKEINDQSEVLSKTIDTLRDEIARKIAEEADIPIPNLTIDGDSIYLAGKNLDDLSTREQVDFVISIVEWQNRDKPLKVICLDRAEVLDDDALLAFVNRIPDDYRFFITIVAHEGMLMQAGTILAEAGTMTELTKEEVFKGKEDGGDAK